MTNRAMNQIKERHAYAFRRSISEKTRAEDERPGEELRNADIGKLKKLIAPLIERSEEKPRSKKSRNSAR
jgi:hypothetical protein